MRLLCIDVGNTNTTLGLFEGSDLDAHWRVATDTRRTADEWGLLVTGLLDGLQPPRQPGGLCLCSAVPVVLHEMRQMIADFFADTPSLLVEPGVRTGLPVLVDNPREVGTDRIANAVAAAHLTGGPCVVVDFGTATTFDVVSAQGQYVGGAIAPGVEVSLDALGVHGAQLRQVELVKPRAVIAKNTVEALQSGAVYGFAGQVDRVVAQMRAQLGVEVGELPVIATGVLGAAVLRECESVTCHEPYLTMQGLRLIFERNDAGSSE